MSHAVHLIAGNFPGYVPCSSRGGGKIHSQIKIGNLKCTSGKNSFVCNANPSGGHRRNPDFSRSNNRNGFSRNRNNNNNNNNNRHTEHRDRYENHDDSEILSSKNGPLLSLSGSPKAQATATPGPQEKEIVQLFRKVQAQLRERAAKKGDRKIEKTTSGKGKESETVDSLLKLLRKHSVEQDKKNGNSAASFDQPEQNGPDNEDKISNIVNSNSRVKEQVPESKLSSVSRPPSSFRRKSPVPQVKYQPEYLDFTRKVENDQVESTDPEPIIAELELVPDVELELEPELEFSAESAIVDENVFDDPVTDDDDDDVEVLSETNDGLDKEDENEDVDLSAMKLTDLRALAKSRGLKGFSKMKKSDLVELLSN